MIAATELEAEPILSAFRGVSSNLCTPAVMRLANRLGVPATPPEVTLGKVVHLAPGLDFLLTGVGVASSAFCLGRLGAEAYDLAIGFGLVGAYVGRDSPRVGEVVVVTHDRFLDYGLWRDGELQPLGRVGMPTIYPGDSPLPTSTGRADRYVSLRGLARVRGNTLAHPSCGELPTSTGLDLAPAQVESMEAACLGLLRGLCPGLELLSLRAVSNRCRPGPEAGWNAPIAIRNLAASLAELLLEVLG